MKPRRLIWNPTELTMRSVASRFVPLIIVGWAGAPFPPKNQTIRRELWQKMQLPYWIIWAGREPMFLDILWLDRKSIFIAIRFLKAKTPEQRAAVDLDTHYSEEFLKEVIGSNTRRAILYQDYVKGITASGMQSNYGFEGQLNACWRHKMTQAEIDLIRSGGFLVSVIHGRQDVIAQINHARRLAQKLQPVARMLEFHGGHLVAHERTEEVNQALLDLVKASEMKMSPHDWNNFPKKSSEASSTTSVERETDRILAKILVYILYIFSLFMMALKYARSALQRLKPTRVEASTQK